MILGTCEMMPRVRLLERDVTKMSDNSGKLRLYSAVCVQSSSDFLAPVMLPHRRERAHVGCDLTLD